MCRKHVTDRNERNENKSLVKVRAGSCCISVNAINLFTKDLYMRKVTDAMRTRYDDRVYIKIENMYLNKSVVKKMVIYFRHNNK